MIQKLIDEYIAERREKRKKDAWSPSSFGQCFRKQYWQREGKEHSNPIDARTLRVFKCGDLFHEFVQNIIKEKYPEAQIEVPVEGHNVKGRADIVLDDEVDDLKSINSRAFWYMDKEGYDVKKEKRPNWLQVACYAVLLGKPKISLCFISKDDLCIRQYTDETKNWEIEVYSEIRILNYYWERKELPPPKGRTYGIDKKTGKSNECSKYCEFRTYCKEVQSEGK